MEFAWEIYGTSNLWEIHGEYIHGKSMGHMLDIMLYGKYMGSLWELYWTHVGHFKDLTMGIHKQYPLGLGEATHQGIDLSSRNLHLATRTGGVMEDYRPTLGYNGM